MKIGMLRCAKKDWDTRLMLRGSRYIAVVMAVVFLILLLFLEFPAWLVDQTLDPDTLEELTPAERLKAENDIRTTTLQLIAGLFFLLTAYYTWQQVLNSRNQIEIARQGQITERFTRAIAQLGDANLDVRLGGVYALERLARNSEEDMETINEILAAFVRGHSPASTKATITQNQAALRIRAADVQAALAILVGAETYNEDTSGLNLERINASKADFQHAKLREVSLSDAQLSFADFDFANLQGVNLTNSDLRGAKMRITDFSAIHHSEVYRVRDRLRERSWIVSANMTNADLSDADLRDANFEHADLTGAILHRTNLQAANLQQTTLHRADLDGANLSYAKGRFTNLLGANLAGANLGRIKLHGANLAGANLKGANLHEADLQEAQLSDADLRGVVLTTTTLKGAKANARTKWPDDFDPIAVGVTLAEPGENDGDTGPSVVSQDPETYDTSRYDVLHEPAPWTKHRGKNTE